MVVTFFPETKMKGVMQLLTATPSTWTVHAPHNPAPQPNFVPLSPNSSLSIQSNGVAPSASTLLLSPFISHTTIHKPKLGIGAITPYAHIIYSYE